VLNLQIFILQIAMHIACHSSINDEAYITSKNY